jgi:tryptophan synthase alpha chain
MSRFSELFKRKPRNVLSVYFPAGFPKLNSTTEILAALQENGVDIVEIGIPYSDPIADGVVIQQSSKVALENGINLDLIFEQLKNIRNTIQIPLVLMGYYNSVLQYGIENFCKKCMESGIDGVILPDLPMDEYEDLCALHFKNAGLEFIRLITPQTSEEKKKTIDTLSNSFIYAVSSSATTGTKDHFDEKHTDYFKRLSNLKLKNPVLVGFGISNHQTFNTVCQFVNGAIIGSAFIKALNQDIPLKQNIQSFIKKIKEQHDHSAIS